MEGTRIDDPEYEKELVASLRNTYSRNKLDLIMVSAHPAFEFLLRHREEIFPGVPIVFFSQDTRRIAGKSWPGITGVTETQDVKSIVDLALHLHPATDTVAIITGTSVIETFWQGELRTALLQERTKIKEVDLVGLPTTQLLTQVKKLPSNTVIFFEIAPRDSIQPAIGVNDVLAEVSDRLPTYCIFPYKCVGHGAVAGIESSGKDEVATTAATLASRVLSGERPEDIPPVQASGKQVLADWRQLHRWNIPISALPPDTQFYNRELTLWQRDRRYIIAALALLVAQTLLIVALLWQRARKRKAEAVLRESERRFRVMADTTPSMIWMCDSQGETTYLNDRWIAFTGISADRGNRSSWVDYTHPDDQKNVMDTLSQALRTRQPFSQECRISRNDGVYRWILNIASPRINGDGSFAGLIGSAIDTTDQKLAQQALEKISGQLIDAQEKERSRIARDLHDDICQRLALLSMELEQVNRKSNDESVSTDLVDARKHCSEIATDVQSLSHQLHSSKLDYLGIVVAIRGFCREFSRQHEANVDFIDNNVPKNLSKEVSLCLFRVTQEALHNAIKYSGTTNFTVELTGTSDVVQLVVTDSGVGFDVELARKNHGLGLVSMQERVHLVHGQFLVESEPGKGTRILVIVPGVPQRQDSFEEPSTKVVEHADDLV